MMRDNESLPFSHERDPELGAALRAALDSGQDAAFTARVLAAFESARAGKAGAASWDAVLERWARVGVAAALVAVLAGYAMSRATPAEAVPPPTPEEAIVVPQSPDAIVIAAFLNR